MRIHKIALYLSGKLYDYYGVPFDRLELIEIIREVSPQSFTEDMFRLIDSKDFYLNCLNRVRRSDENKLEDVIDKLELPEELKYDIIISK